MPDPDDAGDELAQAVWRDLSDSVACKWIKLPSKNVEVSGVTKKKKLYDPGDLNRKQLAKVLHSAGVDYDLDSGLRRIKHRCKTILESRRL